VKLKKIGSFQAGNGFPSKYQGKEKGDYPFAKVGDSSSAARAGKKYLSSANNYVNQEEVAEIKGKTIPVGSIVFAKIGEAIRQNFRTITSVEMLIDNNCMALVPNREVIDVDYLYFWMRQLDLYMYVGATTVPALRKSTLEDIEIPLPPIDEQKRIAAILDKADAIRQKRKQAIDLADEFLRSVFLDMFGGYLGASNNLVSFGDVTKLDAKMVDPTLEEYTDLLHIGPDRIEKRTGKILPALTAREEGLKSKKFLFSERHVIYSKIRPYLRKAAIPDFVALCSADMYPIKPVESKVTREFIWALLLSDFFDNYVCTLPDRASIPKLNKKELAAFQFSLPPYEEIQKFSDIAKETLKNKTTQQAHQSDAKSLFNALSQKAFSGQL
jgi:type I restriction enzyme S subunit